MWAACERCRTVCSTQQQSTIAALQVIQGEAGAVWEQGTPQVDPGQRALAGQRDQQTPVFSGGEAQGQDADPVGARQGAYAGRLQAHTRGVTVQVVATEQVGTASRG